MTTLYSALDSSMKDVIKLIMDRTELHNFLSVPGPDVVFKEAFWHDEHDKSIDCNIYHKKYGYPNEIETAKCLLYPNIVPYIGYLNELTGKYIYRQYYLEVLCSADGLQFTNKDGQKVFKVDYVKTNQKRLAVDYIDFDFIYKREIERKNCSNTATSRIVFCEELTEHLKDLIEKHKANSKYNEGRDIDIIDLANRFIHYLATLIKKPAAMSDVINSKSGDKIPDSLSFKDLFECPDKIDSCLALLKEIEKPAISDENRYIGRNKGILVVWFSVLETRGMFKNGFQNDTERAIVLNYNIKDLNVSASLFSADNVRAAEYKEHFQHDISAIKTSKHSR